MAMTNLTLEEIRDTLEAARNTIWEKMDSDADRYFSNYIFSPDHPGQTPLEKYQASWLGRDDYALWVKLGSAIKAIEDDLNGFNEM